MTNNFVLFGGLFVSALSGVLVGAAPVAAGAAVELERQYPDAKRTAQKIAGPSGDSPSFLRGPGSGSPGRDTSPSHWGVRQQVRRVDGLAQPPTIAGQ